VAAPPDLQGRLARERTALATERTLLAYLRTALAMFAGGATLLHFFDTPLAVAGGLALIPAAVLLLAFGVYRFNRVRHHLGA
jgi:putative membrane protein